MRKDKPSRTALEVAAVVYAHGAHPELASILPPDAAKRSGQLIAASGELKPKHLKKMRSASMRRRMKWADRLYTGHIAYLALRKRFLDDETVAAVRGGARQVLVVGAGYDTLAMRRAEEFPDVLWLEIDHPSTQRAKQRALERLDDFTMTENLHLLPVDLGETTLADTLDACEFWDPEAPSVVVIEGVLMYLREGDVRRFFETVQQKTGKQSKVLFTWMRCDANGKPAAGPFSWLTRLSLRLKGEPLRWGAHNEDALNDFLNDHGWKLGETGGVMLKERYYDPVGIDGAVNRVEFVGAASC